MQHMELLLAALEYIEIHLCDEIRTEDIAAACFCSKSTLEKLFRSVHNISVRPRVHHPQKDDAGRQEIIRATGNINSCYCSGIRL